MPAKFSTLLRKNITVERRSKWKFVAEICIIVFVALVAIVRLDFMTAELDKSELAKTRFFGPDPLDNLNQLKNLLRVTHGAKRFSLFYTPDNAITNQIMASVKETLKLRSVDGFATEHLLESYFDQRSVLAGVVFNSFTADTEVVPKHLNLTIRFPSIFRTISTPKDNVDIWKTRVHGVVESNITEGTIAANKDLYLREGFMQVHHQIFLEWYKRVVDEYAGQPKAYNVTTRNFRHNEGLSRKTLAIHSNYIDFVYFFAFLLPFLNMIWKFGREHEVDMGAQHQLLGFSLGHYWMSHFIVSYIRLLPHCLIFFLIIRIPWPLPGWGIYFKTNPFSLMAFLLLYVLALVVCAMFYAVVIQHGRNAVYLGLTVWLAFFGLFDLVLEQTTDDDILYCMLAFVLFTNNVFPYAMAYLYDEGWRHQYPYIVAAMLGNILMNLLFIVYVMYKKPRRYMDPRPVLPGGRSRCCGRRPKPDNRKKVAILGRTPSWQNFEGRLHMAEDYISLRNVCTHDPANPDKEYLANVSLKAFKDEITAIVGPYGAGKTTILNIVTGWRDFPIGQVHVCKHDIQEEWQQVRPHLGVLMAHNHLFDLLTCRETLRYFVSMKLEQDDHELLTFEVTKWLEMLQPTVPPDLLCRRMTYEQKRLLSLCCILCCHTKVILIDEPVEHMRAKEERQFFGILQREKPNRAIVFTTFTFHTAEKSADRIGILVDGILKAYGTPFFLKDKFGYGFQLILMKQPKFPTEPITELLQEYLRNIAPDNEIGNQVVYLLPKSKRPKFQQILLHLERDKTRLGIADVRLVSTDLNEVYQSLDDKPHRQVISDYTKILKVTYLSEREIRHQQFRAMLYKKMLYPPPNIIPGIMILVSVFVIIFINHLAEVMEIPTQNYHGFQLGFPSSSTNRKILAGFEKCPFLHVQAWQVEIDEHHVGSISRTFTADSFYCADRKFREFAKDNSTLHRRIGSLDLFENMTAVVWVNQRIFHSAAMLLNLLHNRILSETFPDDLAVVTTLIHHPMPLPLSVKILLSGNMMTHLRVPLIVGIIAPITVSTFIFSVAEERRNHLLFLQIMAGMRMSIYWAVNLFWDSLTFATYMIIYCVVMLLLEIDGFSVAAKFTLMLLLSIYGIPALLMTYLISIFTNKSKLRSFLICCILQLMTGLGTFIFYWDLLTYRTFYYICSIFPSFAMLDGAINLYAASKEKEICWNRCDTIDGCTVQTMCHLIPQCCLDTFFKFESPGILHNILLLCVSTLLLVFMLFWVALQQQEQKFYTNEAVKASRSACYPYDDVNVVEIKKSIAAANWRELRLKRFVVDQLENLRPKDGRPLHTVSFVVDKYECLCILGTHHCGKTHLVRQLIGQDGFKFGDVYINGKELKYELRDAHNILGYCPQDYGLVNSYSIRQLMYIICMMRGVLPLIIMELITEICQNLDLKRIMNRRIGRLTHDQRRKVNIAVSLLVYNKVLVLDDPTRGVSPHTRREIWNVLRYARFCGKTLIMTTTSVAECMQMADQTILYEDNEMLAAGTVHDLRFRYTKGLYLDIKLLRDGRTLEEADKNLYLDVENLKRFVAYLHEGAELVGRNDSILMFYLPVPTVSFSALFGSLEKNSRRLNIAEYSVSQGGMDDVLKTISARRVHEKIVYRRKK